MEQFKLNHISLLAIGCLFITNVSFSQTFGDYIQHDWYGYYTSSSEVFVGSDYTMEYSMYNVSYSGYDNSFTATMQGKINIENTIYSCTYAINGSINSDYQVSLNYNYTISSDELPNGLYWIYDNLYGTLYEDSDHPGSYFIHGTNTDGTGTMEISTYRGY